MLVIHGYGKIHAPGDPFVCPRLIKLLAAKDIRLSGNFDPGYAGMCLHGGERKRITSVSLRASNMRERIARRLIRLETNAQPSRQSRITYGTQPHHTEYLLRRARKLCHSYKVFPGPGVLHQAFHRSLPIPRPLKIAILIFLCVATLEDTLIFLMSWFAPDLWFRLFHGAPPAGLETAFLRRSAGQWLAFAIVQAIAILRWRKAPIWLVVVAAVRFSDFFTDISYVVTAASSLTTLGWACLLPPTLLNGIGIVIMLQGYRLLTTGSPATSFWRDATKP